MYATTCDRLQPKRGINLENLQATTHCRLWPDWGTDINDEKNPTCSRIQPNWGNNLNDEEDLTFSRLQLNWGTNLNRDTHLLLQLLVDLFPKYFTLNRPSSSMVICHWIFSYKHYHNAQSLSLQSLSHPTYISIANTTKLIMTITSIVDKSLYINQPHTYRLEQDLMCLYENWFHT